MFYSFRFDEYQDSAHDIFVKDSYDKVLSSISCVDDLYFHFDYLLSILEKGDRLEIWFALPNVFSSYKYRNDFCNIIAKYFFDKKIILKKNWGFSRYSINYVDIYDDRISYYFNLFIL